MEIEQMQNGFIFPAQYADGSALANLKESGLPTKLLDKARSIGRDLQAAMGMGSAWLREQPARTANGPSMTSTTSSTSTSTSPT